VTRTQKLPPSSARNGVRECCGAFDGSSHQGSPGSGKVIHQPLLDPAPGWPASPSYTQPTPSSHQDLSRPWFEGSAWQTAGTDGSICLTGGPMPPAPLVPLHKIRAFPLLTPLRAAEVASQSVRVPSWHQQRRQLGAVHSTDVIETICLASRPVLQLLQKGRDRVSTAVSL
jgi:hypothetical protein